MQITVDVPDGVVDYLDELVAAGMGPSREALVVRAVEREFRRMHAERDAVILRQQGAGDDLDDLVAWSVAHAVDGPSRSH